MRGCRHGMQAWAEMKERGGVPKLVAWEEQELEVWRAERVEELVEAILIVRPIPSVRCGVRNEDRLRPVVSERLELVLHEGARVVD